MEISFKKIFQFLYGPLISVIVFFMQSYKANRERLNAWLGGKKISSFLQFAAIALLILWLLIFAFSSEESRSELTERVKQSFSELKSTKEQ